MLGLLFCFICCFIIYGVFCFYPQAKLQLNPDFSKYFDHKITNYFPEHQSIRFRYTQNTQPCSLQNKQPFCYIYYVRVLALINDY